MEFFKFPSLTNTDREDHVERKIREVESLHPFRRNFYFVIMEKYDGANLALHYDGNELKIASRNQFVDTSFYNCGSAVERARPGVKAIWEYLNSQPGTQTITIFGELVGPKVQGRIRYTEEVDFVPFRIYRNGTPLSVEYMLILLDLFPDSMPTPRILDMFSCPIEGAVSRAKNIVNKGLKTGVTGEQTAEGVVIHFDEPIVDVNDSLIMFKCKDPSFKEDNSPRKKKKVKELTSEQQNVFDGFMNYINDNRVYAVISKIGTVSHKDFGRVLGLVIQDALEDSEIDTSTEEWKAIAQAVNKEVAKEIRPVILQNMEPK